MKRTRLLPNFVFQDDIGSKRMLHDYLGDFTVLAFIHCDKDTHGPATESLNTIVTENFGIKNLDIRGIDIHSSDTLCEHYDLCHVVDVQERVLILCDANGSIRRLFGVGKEDCYFVIGPDRHVIDSAIVVDVARLRLQMSLDVALCTDGKASRRSRKLATNNAGKFLPTDNWEIRGLQPRPRGNASGQ